MALGLKCIIDGHAPKVIKLIDRYALEVFLKDEENPTIDRVFEKVINAGYEIDRQVMAFAYRNSDVLKNIKGASKPSRIQNFEAEGMKKAVRMATRRTNVHSTSDVDSIGVFVAKNIASIFGKVTGKRTSSKSTTKALQDKILSIMNQRLGKDAMNRVQAQKPALTSFEIIANAFSMADLDSIANGVVGLRNAIGSLADIEADIKQAINELGSKINPFQQALFNELVEGVRNGSLDILLTKTDFKKILSAELIRMGFGKEVAVKGVSRSQVVQTTKVVVDWNKVKKALVNGSKNGLTEGIKQELEQTFTPQQTGMIVGHLDRMLDEIKSRHIATRLKDINTKKNKSNKPNMDAIDKLVDLNRLGFFDSSSAEEIMKAMGIRGIDSDIIAEMQALLEDLKDNEKGVSLTYREENIRAIKALLQKLDNKGKFTHEKATSALVGALKDNTDVATAMILTTMGNVTENSTSGVIKTLRTTFGRMIFDLIGAKGNLFKVKPFQALLFWKAFADVLTGGVTQTKTETAFVSGGAKNAVQFWETNPTSFMNRYNLQVSNILKSIKNPTIKGVAVLPAKLIASLVTSISMVNSAFDTAHGTIQVFNGKVRNIREALSRTINPDTGKLYTRAEIQTLISEGIYGKEAVKLAKEKARELIENSPILSQRVNVGKFSRIYSEVLFSNFASKLRGGLSLMNELETSAINVANQELGRVSDLKFTLGNFTEWGLTYRPKGSEGKPYAFDWLAKRMIFAVKGAENWFVQALQRQFFIGAFIAVWDISKDMYDRKSSKNSKPTLFWNYVADFDTQEGIKEYATLLERKNAVMARMQRGIVDGVVANTIGSALLGLVMNMWTGCEDDDCEEKFKETLAKLVKYPPTRRLLNKFATLEIQQRLQYAYDPKTKTLDETKLEATFFDIISNPREVFNFVTSNYTNTGVLGRIRERINNVDIYNSRASEDEKASSKTLAVVAELFSMLKVPFDANYQIMSGETEALKALWTNDYTDISKMSEKNKADYIKTLDYFKDHLDEAVMFEIIGKTMYEKFIGEIKESTDVASVSGVSPTVLESLKAENITTTNQLKEIGRKGDIDAFIAKNKLFPKKGTAIKVHNSLYNIGEGGVALGDVFRIDEVEVLNGLGIRSININDKDELDIIINSVSKSMSGRESDAENARKSVYEKLMAMKDDN